MSFTPRLRARHRSGRCVCAYSKAPGRVGPLTIFYCSPFALLSRAVARSQACFNFLKSVVNSTPDGLIDVSFYLDKATPGNQRRPDHGRTMQCVYWTIVQLPHWFLSRRNGWIPHCYILAKEQQDLEVSDSVLIRFLIRSFGVPSDNLSFKGGFSLEAPNGERLVIRVNRFVSIADGEQHVKSFCLKGFSATIPCGICKNTMGRCVFSA